MDGSNARSPRVLAAARHRRSCQCGSRTSVSNWDGFRRSRADSFAKFLPGRLQDSPGPATRRSSPDRHESPGREGRHGGDSGRIVAHAARQQGFLLQRSQHASLVPLTFLPRLATSGLILEASQPGADLDVFSRPKPRQRRQIVRARHSQRLLRVFAGQFPCSVSPTFEIEHAIG